MSNSAARFWTLASLLLAINVLGLIWIRTSLVDSIQPRLRVVSVTPSGRLDGADRISLTFHEPMVAERQVGESIEKPLFTLSPSPEGHWEWAASDRLEFIPKSRLPMGRAFTLALSPEAARLTGREPLGQVEYRLTTSPVALDDVRVLAVEPDEAVTLELVFNQVVDPATLADHLQIRAGKQTLRHRALTTQPGSTLPFRVERAAKSVTLELTPGLLGQGAELPLATSVVRDVAIPSLDHLDLLGVRSMVESFEPDVAVIVTTTAILDPKQPKPEIRIDPPVPGVRTLLFDKVVRLEGPFASGVTYRITLPATLVSKDGKTLGSAKTVTCIPEERDPAVRLPFASGSLSPSGALLLDAQLVNVRSLSVGASRIQRNNLVPHLRGVAAEYTARAVTTREIKVDGPRNVVQKAAVDLKSLIDQPRGLYRLSLAASESRWTNDAAVVAVTDLAVHAKRGRGGLVAWVTSISRGLPVAGIRLTLVSENNQELASGASDASGLATLTFPDKHPDGKPWVVIAESNDGDLGFLELGKATDLLDDVDQSGRAVPETYDLCLYTERGIYLPGETVHLTGLIRDPSGATPEPFPLVVSVHRPDGCEVAQVPVTPQAGGFFHADYVSSAAGHVGRYRFEVHLPGASESLGRAAALIQDFVPPRIEVHATVAQTLYAPGRTPELAVDAAYLIGRPAADLRLSVDVRHELSRFTSSRWPGFVFDLPADVVWVAAVRQHPALIEARTDASGRATLPVPAPTSPGYWKSTLAASVTESGGRTVSATTSTDIDTQGLHLGLRLGADPAPGSTIPLEWAFVRSDAAAATPSPISFSLVRVETEWTLERVGDKYAWHADDREVVLSHWQTNAASERGGESIRLSGGGRHRVHAKTLTTGDQAVASMLEFEVPWGQGESASASRPERVALTLDRASYEPGQTAVVTVASPFAGTLLLTLEVDHVLSTIVRDVPATPVRIDLPIPATLRGGAYVAASVVRPLDATRERWLPVCAKGLAHFDTEHAAQRLSMQVEAPSQASPGERVRVRVQTPPLAGAGAVHLWAVDDGVLQATAYAKPDPHATFLGRRRLSVASEDSYRDLLPDYKRPADWTRIGGDGDAVADTAIRGRLSRRAVVSGVVWHDLVSLASDGHADVELDMPAFTGRLRLFAVAARGDEYASLDQTITLTTPLMIEASFPTFMAPGDSVVVPVRFINTTATSLKVSTQAIVSGAAKIEGSLADLDLAPGASASARATLVASGEGDASVRLVATAQADHGATLQAFAEGAFTLRVAGGYQTIASVRSVKPGESVQFERDPMFDPQVSTTRVTIAPTPTVQLAPALDSLIDYPHGCLEQTSSRLYALLEASQTLGSIDPTRAAAVDQLINAGVARLWAMQTSTGGLAYWPGEQTPHTWGTAYAAELLVRLKESGRPVDARFLTMVTSYLSGRMHHARGETIDDDTRAMICDVLARLGHPQPGWVATLYERASTLDRSGRAHLATALHGAGEVERARTLLRGDTLTLPPGASVDARFTSPLAQSAELLWTLLRIDPGHEWVPVLVTQLEAARSRGRWGSTVEDAAAFCALARYARSVPSPSPLLGSLSDGATTRPVGGAAPLALSLDASHPSASLSLEASSGPAFATVVSRGRTKEISPAFDRGLRVRREWTAADGTPLDWSRVQVGDLIDVKITLDAPGASAPLTHVAVVDLIPALCEVENPALATAAGRGERRLLPDRTEFRDDRVVIFTDASEEARTFTYALRVIAAGACEAPPVQASSMYDAGIASVGGETRRLEVTH